MKCTACGSTSLIEGVLLDEAGAEDKKFVPKDVSYLKRLFGMGGRKVQAWGCIKCSHLQFVIEFTDEDRARFREFAGQQPSVLERLNPESSSQT